MFKWVSSSQQVDCLFSQFATHPTRWSCSPWVYSRESLVSQGFQQAPTTDEMRWLLCSEKSPTFLSERKSSKPSQCFVNKTYIIKTEWKRKGSLVLSYVLVCKCCASVNFSRFFGGLHGISSCANVCNCNCHHLFIACNSWLCGR